MTKNEFYFPSADKKNQIHTIEWIPEDTPKGILQISHGVTEHMLRYEEMAKYFTDRGFVLVGNDHLGHGLSILEGAKPMYFGPEGSWQYVVEDVRTCKELITGKYPNIPHILLGFSLGSFVVRTYLIQYPGQIDGVILVGTGQTPAWQINMAKFVAKKEAKKAGEDNTTPAIHKLTFETYNKQFAPNRTDYDWLCVSQNALDKYIEDPLRGEDMSSGLFMEMLNGMLYTGNINNQRKMDMHIPILLVSGDEDPVGDSGKGVERTYRSFQKVGVQDISLKLYEGRRHDILHDDKSEEVFGHIYEWIQNKFLGV